MMFLGLALMGWAKKSIKLLPRYMKIYNELGKI